jgi:hypothetical protein
VFLRPILAGRLTCLPRAVYGRGRSALPLRPALNEFYQGGEKDALHADGRALNLLFELVQGGAVQA